MRRLLQHLPSLIASLWSSPSGIALWVIFGLVVVPLLLIEANRNWRAASREILGRGKVIERDRRAGGERRNGFDRRKQQTPVAVERRSGRDRRQADRRQTPALIVLGA